MIKITLTYFSYKNKITKQNFQNCCLIIPKMMFKKKKKKSVDPKPQGQTGSYYIINHLWTFMLKNPHISLNSLSPSC